MSERPTHANPESSLTSIKILLVEDDRDSRAALYERLTSWGHEALVVSDALHAVALLDETNNGIELVILDLDLPRLSGDEFMKSYAHWTKCRTRFLTISGRLGPDAYLDHAKVAGCLHKPIPVDTLKRMVEEAEEALTAGAKRG